MSDQRTILLATDLSARSDRAMDRAAALMKEWNCRLLVVHILEPRTAIAIPEATLAARARNELCEQLSGAGDRVSIRIERGEPADAIRRIAREENCSLIVTGVARNESFGRIVIGNTVDGLTSGLEIPLLVVTDRPRGPYRRVTVAVDLDDASRTALTVAADMFPDPTLNVFHAHAAPGSYAASNLQEHREAFTKVARDDVVSFLSNLSLSDSDRARLHVEVQFGDAALQLAEWAEAKQVELVVVGTSGRGRIGELLLGSVAKRVLAALSCDVLVVPPGRPTG
jgi:nucleotide-binding universal stress UspA family protein